MKELITKNYKIITFFIVIILIFSSVNYYFSNIYQPEKMLGDDIRLFRNTPVWQLAKAVNNEDIEKINKLVKYKNFPIDFQEPKFGQSLLFWATYCGREKSVETLLELGADPNLQDHYRGDNAILMASEASTYSDDWCRTNLLELILKYGGDPNSINFPKYGDPPLTNASSLCLKKVKLLVDAGADINYVNESGVKNPLRKALSMKKLDIIKYLLFDKKANYHNAEKWIRTEGDTIKVLSYLRDWAFPLNSEEYKIKMEIVEYM